MREEFVMGTNKEDKEQELYHIGLYELNSRAHFNLAPAKSKPIDIQKMLATEQSQTLQQQSNEESE